MQEESRNNWMSRRGEPFVFNLAVNIEDVLIGLLVEQLEAFKVKCVEAEKEAEQAAAQERAKIDEKDKASKEIRPADEEHKFAEVLPAPVSLLETIDRKSSEDLRPQLIPFSEKVDHEPADASRPRSIRLELPIQSLLPPNIYSIDIDTFFKLINLVSSSIARTSRDAWDNAWRYFTQKIITQLPPISMLNSVIKNTLEPVVLEVLKIKMVTLLLQILSDAVLQVPTIEQLYSENPSEARTDLGNVPENFTAH